MTTSISLAGSHGLHSKLDFEGFGFGLYPLFLPDFSHRFEHFGEHRFDVFEPG